MTRKLTPKQEAFAREYVVLGCGSQAYRKAYSVKRMSANAIACEATKLLKDPRIAHIVQGAQQKAADDSGVSTAFVLTSLRKVHDRAMQAIPVLDKTGKETGEWRHDSMAANKALELMGKHLGLWKEKADSPSVLIAIQAENITCEQDVANMTTPEIRLLLRENVG